MKALWQRRRAARRPYSPVDLPPPPFAYQALVMLLATIATWILLSSLSVFWNTNPGTLKLMLIAAAAIGFGWLAWRSPLAAWGTTALGALTWVLLYRYVPTATAWGHGVGQGWQSVVTQLGVGHWQLAFDPDFGLLLLMVCGLALAIVFVRETLGHGRTLISLLVGCLVLLSEWLQMFDKAATHLSFFVPAALAMWAVGALAYRHSTWAKAGRTVRYTTNVLPAMVLVGLVLTGMFFGPHNIEPVNLGKLGTTIQKAIPVWLQKRGLVATGFRFGLRYTGFSRDGLLGGPAAPDDRTALQVRFNRQPESTVYLRGLVADTYTGHLWEMSKNSVIAEVKQGTTLSSNYPVAVPNEFLTMEITPAELFTPGLFAPLEPVALTQGPTAKYTATGELQTDSSVRKPYVMSVRMPKYSGEQIQQLSLVDGRVQRPAPGTPDGKVFDQYLQLPTDFPNRVRERAVVVTQGAANPYAAALAIEAHLRSGGGYRYTLTAPDLPSDRDFVDYFLFDAKEGYCTSFAAAMTTMLRSLSIPARWVEGYSLPPGLAQAEADGSVTYQAKNIFAHAWVEAWFPGYGWVTFDPTPRADIPPVTHNTPMPVVADAGTVSQDDAGGLSDAATRNLQRDRSLELGDEATGAATVAAKTRRQQVETTGAAVAALVLLAGAWWWVRRRHPGLRRPGASAPVSEHWERFMRLMGLFGHERTAGTTALEYARTLALSWPELAEPMQAVARDYTAALYGPANRVQLPEQNAQAQELLARACQAVQERFGPVTYFSYPLRPRWSRQRYKPVPLPDAAD